MLTSTLLSRNLSYYWRSNLAVVLGVATAVAVLSGALLVGDSVRGSLRDLFVQRLGRTDHIVVSTSFFREKLSDELQADPRFARAFSGACPLIALNGLVTDEQSRRRASGVQVYGVDDRFWKFHSREPVKAPSEREVLLSPDLAREMGTGARQSILLRIEKPSAIPAGSLHGRKDDLGRTIRLTSRETLTASDLGEFSIRPSQGPVRAIFVSLARLQKDLEQAGKVNTILLSEGSHDNNRNDKPVLIAQVLRDKFALEDLGLKLRVLDQNRGIALESDTAIITDELYALSRNAASRAGLRVLPILSYLANSIRIDDRDIPYSLVTAINSESFELMRRSDLKGLAHGDVDQSLPPILLNSWAAGDLKARLGDVVTLEYYLWKDEGLLSTHTARFQLAGIVPMNQADDRDYVPDYPGITTTQNISDWDPPFPVDLKRVRPQDEQYWHQYRTAPKAFIPLEAGQQLWQSRYGKLTSLRLVGSAGKDPATYLESFKQSLRATLDPVTNGFSINPVRLEGLEASRGATDFGEYFVYFSFFLVASALLLASLFFKLGVEQRLREIGTLRAIGFPAALVRSLFLREGLVLATFGSILGMIGAVGYGELMMYGLRTWWVDAVGTTNLRLHVSALSLLLGGAGGIVIAGLCIAWTLRRLASSSPRSLLTGSLDAAMQSTRPGSKFVVRPSGGSLYADVAVSDDYKLPPEGRTTNRHVRLRKSPYLFSIVFAVSGVAVLIFALLKWIGQTGGFFGAGTLLLAASLFYEYGWLTRRVRNTISGNGWWSVSRLGFRNATYRPGRSVLCIALIASASFIIVAVDAFKQDKPASSLNKKSGSGGFPLMAESLLPLYHDPNTPEGREALNIIAQSGFDPASVSFTRFRVRPGDDTSCLNLYQPRNPRILGAGDDFIHSGRFSFSESLAEGKEETENPWILLDRELPDGAVPVFADANSMTYVLHRKLGDEIVVNQSNGESAKLRLVGALDGSIFQGELLMSETNFLRLFPDQGGYGFFLLEAAPEASSVAEGVLEEQLSDFGFDVVTTTERLASFHRVENTYLTTFQTLGGLGLILGTLGLATVLLRNVIERRRELALLRAMGYNSGHFELMVITENAFLVCCGLVTGVACAMLAIAPAFASRGGHLPALSLWLLLSVFVTGLLASLAATIAALRSPLLPALRAE
ncbi:MAG TPA: FtsX-like permease family protein [Blastocatellia bacterium]|nr:FtsX-like permease family protein [Blastocatellia bacterium]